MHFRSAGIGETDIDIAIEQRAHEAFRAVHKISFIINYLTLIGSHNKTKSTRNSGFDIQPLVIPDAHSASRNPVPLLQKHWIPASAGMTLESSEAFPGP
jgi:hypothetical protein